MATTEQKLKHNAYKESILKNSANANNTVIGESTTPRPTGPVGTTQIGAAGSDVGTGAVAGLQQMPNLMNKATPSANATKQAGESLVGTGAIAGMPDNYVNFNDVAEVFDKRANADVNQLRNGQPINNNTEIPSVETSAATVNVTPAISTTGTRRTVANTGPVLKNADVNLSQYGDDSSAENYNNLALVGGENDKYTGENTLNSNIAYDPNATLEGLDPNYQYGWDAQLANSNEAGYIARRNDQIASALYNAGLTSLDDVANYLYKQEGFLNSNDAERRNTIASIYKRLGEISQNVSSNGIENENNGQGNAEGGNSSAVSNMEQDLLQPTAGAIYGKNTADVNGEGSAIKTTQDQYNVERAVNEQRIANMKNLQTMDSKDIATSIVAGTTPYGDQGMRDLMQYDPQKYQEVQNYIKQIKGQKNINSISQNGTLDSESSITSTDIEGDIDSWAKQNSTDGNYKEIASSVKEELESNETASTAQKEMNNLSADIAKLQTRLKNIDREARNAFKSDVPQYLVNAYKANKQLEIQDKISELESRYNTALDLYKTELSNTQWNAEFGLKQQQLAMQQQSQNFDQWYKKQTLQNSSILKDSSGTNWQLKQGTDGNLYYEKIENVSSYTASGMKGAGLRNNNPGNIKDTGFGNVLGTDSRGFAMFATPEDGFDALVAKIENVQNGGSRTYSANMSLYDFFSKYAPSSDNNNPKAYAESVAKQLGTTANATVGSVDPTAFAAAIAKHDSGYDYSTYGQFRGGATSTGEGQWARNDGTVFNMNDSLVYNSLDDKGKSAVKQLLNNSISKTQVNSRVYSDPEGILAAVYEINPMWSETDFNNRKTAESNWTKLEIGGAISRNATAATAAKRIFDLVDSISDKDLMRTGITSLNDLINSTSEKFGNETITRLKTELATLQSEAAGALKGGNASISDKDKEDMARIFNAGMTNGQIKSAMEEMVKLLYDKNETEAAAIARYSFMKKDPIWTQDVSNWMANDLGIDLGMYYNYRNPNAIDLSGLQELANMLNF